MARTFHHHAQQHIRSRFEVWSKRCRKVSMWTFNAFMKRVTHRHERREGKRIIAEQITDAARAATGGEG